MTAGISLIPGKTGAHRAPLQFPYRWAMFWISFPFSARATAATAIVYAPRLYRFGTCPVLMVSFTDISPAIGLLSFDMRMGSLAWLRLLRKKLAPKNDGK